MADVKGTSKNATETVDVERTMTGTDDTGHEHGLGESSRAHAEGEGNADGHAHTNGGIRGHDRSYSHTHYRVYKRRWFGLLQLVLLNIVVSWDWLTFAPVSTKSADYFGVTETSINWLSTAFLFSFAVMCPVTIWTLNRSPKEAILWASVLLFIGNWVRYAGTKATGGHFGVVMFGQILTGFAQPFVLSAPTRYSDQWFTESGRVSATAFASLANPFGAALAQLINPFWGNVPNIVLYVSVLATVACIPSFFIPAAPPTPASASSAHHTTSIKASAKICFGSPSFWILFVTFGVYVGFFNAFSSLLNQVLYPYGYSEDEAGICGAVLIVVGLVTAAINSPIIDRTHAYVLNIKVLCLILACSYLGMIWAPETRGIVAPYVLAAILGAASFALLPIALEYIVEVTYPASPEVGSTICWTAGQLLGGIFIVVMNALKDQRAVDLEAVREAGRNQGGGDRPPGNMYSALVFQAIVAVVVLPLPLALGIKKLGLGAGKIAGRLKVDEHRTEEEVDVEGDGQA
ncbi:MFS general substrate transporter [Pleomassaria siparia CBS 279.74]|uniref:MFS general substrate transporter n=1 Tax=Pleomassaria siparia CBS 279.74 TaxID=1314801 RepID=A0A6G1K0J4_9PLEO|nr:MFS general substrate transporter [Pleomassaria siparia CBS 279.74]